MGGVVDTLFGSPSKEKSESGNHAWDEIKGAFKPALGYLTQGGDAAWNMLKQGPGGFADTGGFKFLMDQGTNQVNSNFYSRGLGQSGAAMKGLEKYRYGLASTYLNQYMDQLNNFSKLGIGAGGVMSSAGQYSKGSSKGGKDGIAGDIIGAIAMSDARLKTNVVPAGRDEAGVPFYYFNYINKPGRWYGVIAQELQKIAPDKVVETANGYLAVREPYLPKKID
jgi:hypothetical protein